jgi:hypothetical protein
VLLLLQRRCSRLLLQLRRCSRLLLQLRRCSRLLLQLRRCLDLPLQELRRRRQSTESVEMAIAVPAVVPPVVADEQASLLELDLGCFEQPQAPLAEWLEGCC